MLTNVYTDNGFKDRRDYLSSLTDEFDVPLEAIETLADLLGPDEDFDGLITTLNDFSESLEY